MTYKLRSIDVTAAAATCAPPHRPPALLFFLQLLRHRAYLDPKRHYKGGGVDGGRLMELPRFFQVGTVVEAAHERLSRDARLTRRERKGTLVEALLADERLRQYAKRNYDAVAAEAARGGRKSKSLGGGGAAVSRKGRKSGGGKKR